MISYPKWMYHASEAARIVNDEAEKKALGAGWVEAPVEAKKKEPKEAK